MSILPQTQKADSSTQLAGPRSQPKITRRSFLELSFLGSLGLLLAQVAAALLKFLRPVKSGGFGGEIFAGRVEEFPVGSVNRVFAGRFYIVRTEAGLLAVYQKCTHLGCAVPWVEVEGQFHCPCHGSVFNAAGEVTGGPAPRPLDIFPVAIRDGEVWVDTGKPIERDRFDPSQVTGVTGV